MKNLTVRYSFTQFTFWAASSGAASFAAAYLLERGVSSSYIGLLLAAAGLLSCLTQPILADAVDRSNQFLIIRVLISMSVICAICFGIQLFPALPTPIAGICYVAGIWSSDVIVPLLNALCVSYAQAGFSVDYGAARGIGSAASAISSLILGHVIARVGNVWMLLLLIFFRFLCILSLLGYPQIQKSMSTRETSDDSCSIRDFLLRYRWYCVSLIGILFLGMYHAMTENYMIAIIERLGGDSRHVGTALFISAMTGAPVIFCIQRVRKVFADTTLLKIAACSFLLKSILFCFAGSIEAIYFIQLLQATSYAFLAPTQVYYAQAKVRQADMVKGQAFITAAYALGCAGGNLIGGQLLNLGVEAVLTAGVGMTIFGTLILFLTVKKNG